MSDELCTHYCGISTVMQVVTACALSRNLSSCVSYYCVRIPRRSRPKLVCNATFGRVQLGVYLRVYSEKVPSGRQTMSLVGEGSAVDVDICEVVVVDCDDTAAF